MYLYELNKEDLKLSVAEVLALSNCKNYKLYENLLLISKNVSERLAMTKRVFKVIFVGSKSKYKRKLVNSRLEMYYKKNFALRLHSDLDKEFILKTIWDKLDKPEVDLSNPTTEFHVFVNKGNVIFTKLLFKNQENFEVRKAHNRPELHPSSLHPKLARTLVNLVAKNEVCDPFCGSGGILMEAGLMGLSIYGYDTDEIMLRRAEINLKHFGIKKVMLRKQDARTFRKHFEAVVTDLPYGKSTKSDELRKLYLNFLINARSRVKKMVVCFPSFVPHKALLQQTGWKVVHHFSWYLHRNLSKKVLVLK